MEASLMPLNRIFSHHPDHSKMVSKTSNEVVHFKRNNSPQFLVNNLKEDPITQEVPSATSGLADLQVQKILSIMQGKGATQSTNP